MKATRPGIDTARRLSADHDSVLATGQMLAAGIDKNTIDQLEAIGHIRRVFSGIYLVGAPALTQSQLMRCAHLKSGGGPLAGRTALEVRQVLSVQRGSATVLTRRSRGAGVFATEVLMADGGRGLVKVRRPRDLPDSETVSGLLATPVPRSLVDLVGFGGGRLLDRAWREAEFRGLLDHDDLAREVQGSRRPGATEVATLVQRRQILTSPDTDLRSKKELPWLHRIVAAGLPVPQVNAVLVIDGVRYVVDFYWPEYRFVLELDSPDHLQPAAGARDRVRDVDLFLAGIDSLRFLDTEVDADPEAHLARLAAALDRQMRRVA